MNTYVGLYVGLHLTIIEVFIFLIDEEVLNTGILMDILSHSVIDVIDILYEEGWLLRVRNWLSASQ